MRWHDVWNVCGSVVRRDDIGLWRFAHCEWSELWCEYRVASIDFFLKTLTLQILTLLFIAFGSVADYGSNGKWMLIGVTLVFWASQFALISVKCTISPKMYTYDRRNDLSTEQLHPTGQS